MDRGKGAFDSAVEGKTADGEDFADGYYEEAEEEELHFPMVVSHAL